MPLTGLITTGLGLASGYNQNKQAKKQSAFEREQFDWQKQIYNDEQARKNAASNAYWTDYNNTPDATYADSMTQASNQLNPLYDVQMKDTLDSLNNNLKSRGFFGQAPGAALNQEAASKVLTAKNTGIANLANQFYQTGLDRKLQQKNLGVSTFGSYGNTV
jgi:transketolase